MSSSKFSGMDIYAYKLKIMLQWLILYNCIFIFLGEYL